MLRAGWQRRILRPLAFPLPLQLLDSGFQLCNLRQQQADDGLRFRRLAGDDFFRDSQRQALVFAEYRPPCPDQFTEKIPPGCERLPEHAQAHGR